MSLSDQDVQRQISQMVAFIEQDAKEKAQEITQKAIADYNLEKNRMINAARTRLDAEKEKKLKQIELQRKIHISTQINQQRLKVLKHRWVCHSLLSFLGVGKKFRLLMQSCRFSPDLFMKISNFSKTVHTIFTKFCTVILHPKGPLRVQRHQNRMAGMWET